MNVHIVCSLLEIDRILPRLAHSLADATGWTVGPTADPKAKLNYYLPYLELRRGQPIGPSAALFTHREENLPGKAKIWDTLAKAVDIRITWAQQYAANLEAHGRTVRLTPPLDREAFVPKSESVGTRSRLRAGVSGYVYSGGRKGEQLLQAVLSTSTAARYDWQAVGRGWPVRTTTVAYSQLPAFYQGLDLYVCPSQIEGIPYGPLEALACGVPVIVPRGVGILDELPNVSGIIRYDAGDAVTLEVALGEAYTQIECGGIDRSELREVTSRFTMEGWVEGHVEAFGAQSERVTRAKKSDHGIYVVAYGEPARACAENLIVSIRTHMPDTPIAVASDRPLAAADVFTPHPDQDLGGRAAKTKMWDLAPKEWEYVLYLDADTELVAPIPFLFDVLRDGWELVCTKDVKGYDLIHSLWRRDSEEHRLGWEAIGSDRALQLAGGVMGFRRTPATEAFLSAWYAEWNRMARRDQGALLRALYTNPVRLLVLGSGWNRFEGGICPEATAGIIHYRNGPARRVRGWVPGRLDDSALWAQVSMSGRASPRGIEGVIRDPESRRYHVGATMQLTYVGPKEARRVAGRSGRQYIFPKNQPVTVVAEDAKRIVSPRDPSWEAEPMDCPVCHAPDGNCTGNDVEKAKESTLVDSEIPMRLPKQHSRLGKTGYVGEEAGLVTTFEKKRRFPVNGGPPPLAVALANMSDKELTSLGVQRRGEDEAAKESEPALKVEVPATHVFEANSRGVNCKVCRKPEDEGRHHPPVVVSVVREDKEPAVARHTPKAGAAEE